MEKPKTEQEAIELSIEHWKRMIAWAEKQKRRKKENRMKMQKNINEHWGFFYCSLYWFLLKNKNNCRDCPISKKYGECVNIDIKNRNKWMDVDNSKTWGEWAKNAKAFLIQLESLL